MKNTNKRKKRYTLIYTLRNFVRIKRKLRGIYKTESIKFHAKEKPHKRACEVFKEEEKGNNSN